VQCFWARARDANIPAASGGQEVRGDVQGGHPSYCAARLPTGDLGISFCAAGNTDDPADAHVGDLVVGLQVVVKHLKAVVGAIRNATIVSVERDGKLVSRPGFYFPGAPNRNAATEESLVVPAMALVSTTTSR